MILVLDRFAKLIIESWHEKKEIAKMKNSTMERNASGGERLYRPQSQPSQTRFKKGDCKMSKRKTKLFKLSRSLNRIKNKNRNLKNENQSTLMAIKKLTESTKEKFQTLFSVGQFSLIRK